MPTPTSSDVPAEGGRGEPRQLALFDLDGTITTANIFLTFIEHVVGARAFRRGLLSLAPQIALHYARRISPRRIKEIFIEHYFGDRPLEELHAHARDFTRTRLGGLIRPRAMQCIRWHQEQGHRVVIVSACVRTWFDPWVLERDLQVIATELEVREGRVTGRLATENCHGPEKVKRVRACFDLASFDRIYAYGDSAGDREMLAIAHERYYKPFR
jgi:HAD superfamily hydrolase (TIGR01490 family)